MKQWKWGALALVSALMIVGCGGGGGTATSNSAGFTSLVTFGDSLSDVGTYAVGTVAALKGGRYTINSGDLANPSNIWVDLIAAQYGLPKPCPATTGLNSRSPFGAPVAAVNNTACRNYAQGGARVTLPVGPGHTALPDSSGGMVGQLDYPIATQIANHLAAVGGSFNGKELVTVLAGGNDAFMNGAAVSAVAAIDPTNATTVAAAQGAASIAGWSSAEIAAISGGGSAAITAASGSAVAAMGKAGAELAGYVKSSILGKGAKYVLVLNLPDLGSSINALENPASKPLLDAMTAQFNAQLAAGLKDVPGVVLGDTFAASADQYKNPAAYGLTNVKDRACSRDLTKNALGGTSLLCNPANLNTGDVSHYLTADDVHPTPYGHKLLAQFAAKVLAAAGWL